MKGMSVAMRKNYELLGADFTQQETQVRDSVGNRWVKCEYCEKIAKTDEFVFYGGLGRVNLGICRDCSYNNPAVKEDSERRKAFLIKKYSSK